jgi:septum formation protein
MTDDPSLVLGSSSPFRRALLERFDVEFEVVSPDIDETPHDGEDPQALVRRLSVDKARAVARLRPNALIISSDQVAVIGGDVIGKPHDHARAVAQLTRASGRDVTYLTGLCVLNAPTDAIAYDRVDIVVGFKVLDPQTIEAYLHKDKPYACAGAIRAEGAASALFNYVRTDDPSALIGLPLIRLSEMLGAQGLDVLRQNP